MSIVEHQANRIATLEHALDQALLVIADVREQLKEQHILEAQLSETEQFSNIQQKAIASLQEQLKQTQAQAGYSNWDQNTQTNGMDQAQNDFMLTSQKKEELERQVDHLSRREAQLQHQCLELTEQCHAQDTRIQLLEKQVHDLQEQVLQQVQQLREQETAIQHWKGRCQAVYTHLHTLVDTPLPLSSPALEEVLASLKKLAENTR